mmetsp:Transcript_25835/g.39086  ORF Transcript_25835/g.39086 Transcript_25835/m.39086 type:complete len:83 (-) Transcript_25835:140-388(-)
MSCQNQLKDLRRLPKYKLFQLRDKICVCTDYKEYASDRNYKVGQHGPLALKAFRVPEYIFIQNAQYSNNEWQDKKSIRKFWT